MRSYWMSLTFVAVLLLGYTAVVLNSPRQPSKSAATEPQPREPAAAQQAATQDEAASNVN